ncbi:hypothetical protein CPB83DRAFT_772029 [Crepidotus variabilis]|uniref:BTB domain-containing protein n=1 Tax=Crepidotus variabilis TaxID=179855 RepID=A0A9P6JLT6_9AGAR|nr:hypothetical protein CPB83DRAFT_772029 [Crepidotus variabilis]
MVNLYLFKSAKKLHILSALLIKIPKRALRTLHSRSPALPIIPSLVTQPTKCNFPVLDLVQAAEHDAPPGSITRDVNYYKDSRECGMCVFRVENTLFKVHKCYIVREPCAFEDMFSFPYVGERVEGQCDEAAIPLSDTAEQFRDLLWALYASPAQLLALRNEPPAVQRLLNIALLANKYCIASYEAWSLDCLTHLAQSPSTRSFLRSESSKICSQVLEISALCGRQALIDVSTRHLINRILWSDFDRQPIYRVAKSWGLTELQSVIFYRDLVELARPGAAQSNAKESEPAFLANISDERQRSHLNSAYRSLVALWERVRRTPPAFLFPSDECGCPSHANCVETWGRLWSNAAASPQTLQVESSNVLGRLKEMMIQLHKMVMEENDVMCMDCSMAALESITSTKDGIILGLSKYFKL